MKLDHKPNYLTIQKAIKLLGQEHLNLFRQYLKSINATLPLKLVDSIEPGFEDDTEIDALCTLVYGTSDHRARRTFNQLASHTFQLTAYLSRNFPNYLNHNVGAIEFLLMAGKPDEANLLAECLLDVAGRIGNYSVQVSCMKFFAQQAVIFNNKSESLKYFEEIRAALSNDLLLNELYFYARKHFDIGRKDDSILQDIDKHLAYFEAFHQHEAPAVRLLSKYCTWFISYYFRSNGNDLIQPITEFYQELTRNAVIIFPLLEDLLSKTSFLLLNNSKVDIHQAEAREKFNILNKHLKQTFFWKNYNSLPQMFVIAIKTTFYVSRYHSEIHNANFINTLPQTEQTDIRQLINSCEELLGSQNLKENFVNDYIKLRLTYAVVLLLGGPESIRKSTSDLEELMITFQQTSFSASIDSIFACLMIGYFASGNYRLCGETYNRYIKLAKGRILITENDIDIHTYYYMAQWLSTKRQQYINKFIENYARAGEHSSNDSLQKNMRKLAAFYKIAADFQEP